MIHSSYLYNVFHNLTFVKAVATAKKKLRHVKFDAFAVTGNSGTLMGGALSLAMKKRLILVRKKKEKCHSFRMIEGDDTIGTYIFLDDVLCDGETRDRVVKEVRTAFPDCKMIGSYYYRDLGSWWPNEKSVRRS